MGWEAWMMLGVVVLIFLGLLRNVAPPDVILMGGAVVVGLAGIVSPQEVFHGFTNEGLLTVAALFVVAAALRETGVLDNLGARILGSARNESRAFARLAGPILTISAFLNNTPVVAMMMPIISGWCRKNRVSPSRLLLPVSYLAILGGTCTLIGTSTNLVVNGMLIEQKRPGMTLFELTWLGLPYAFVGTLYLVLIGRRLLPDRKDMLEQIGERPREYLVDMIIQPGCRLIGQKIEQAGLRRLPGLFLMEISRKEQVLSPVGPDEVMREGDRLTFTGVVSTIVDLERIPGLVPAVDDAYETRADARRHRRLCEAVISPTSPLVGKNIRQANFRASYNAAVVAVHRGGARLVQRIGDIVLQPGDTLLLQTGPHFAQAHRNDPDFFLVSTIEEARPVRHERATLSLVLLLVLIVLMGVSPLIQIPIVLIAFAIAGLMVAGRCISAADARQSIDWQTLLTIGAAFGISKGLENSGAAAKIAEVILIFDTSQVWGRYATLAAVYLTTMVLTELITNNAAAVLVFPFAMSVAAQAGLELRPFAVAIAFAASASFATPIGYQTNMMVYGPGGYKFTDFLRVGLPLNLLLASLAVALIPIIWPFVAR